MMRGQRQLHGHAGAGWRPTMMLSAAAGGAGSDTVVVRETDLQLAPAAFTDATGLQLLMSHPVAAGAENGDMHHQRMEAGDGHA